MELAQRTGQKALTDSAKNPKFAADGKLSGVRGVERIGTRQDEDQGRCGVAPVSTSLAAHARCCRFRS